ncbi:HAMP domain-containing protein [Massilia sp. FT127W]|uniref:HAMP domain-containing protein n=1 Tax=Pseudoduganella aquatica TaxID=2660641 RepID=A0A7X4HHG5_9BURK|nr:HAMP domain-containing protein [Pseudoduganella aquatica]
MSRTSIKRKLQLGLSAIIAIILLLLGGAYYNLARLSHASELDNHTMEVLLRIDQVTQAIQTIQIQARGFLLNGSDTSYTLPQTGMAGIHEHIAEVAALTRNNPDQQQRMQQLDRLVRQWIATAIEPLVAKRRELGSADATAKQPEVGNSRATVAAIRELIAAATAEEQRLKTERAARTESLQHTLALLLAGGGALCVALAAAVGWQLTRTLMAPVNALSQAVGRIAAGEQSARAEVVSGDELGQVTLEFNRMAQAIEDNTARELADTRLLKSKVDSLLEVVSKAAAGDLTAAITVGGDDAIGRLGHGLEAMLGDLRTLLGNVQKAGIMVTTSATEIAAASRQQEATGVEQAQTSVEVLSTTKEISSNTTQLLQAMENATAVADYTTSATAEAQDNLKRMDDTMQHMVSATDSISAKLAALSEKASNINSVLTTITKVADQTNILSLNAAIEAEKAGEAGRGFSVVATEIRRLADQTSVSTWDIEQMLKEMQSAVSASVMGMDKFSEEVRRSVGEVRQVTDQLSGVMDQVQKLSPQFDAVLQGMQSQAVGAQQITETMMQLNDATQQSVTSLRSTSEAVLQLQYAAGDLQASVSRFDVAARPAQAA